MGALHPLLVDILGRVKVEDNAKDAEIYETSYTTIPIVDAEIMDTTGAAIGFRSVHILGSTYTDRHIYSVALGGIQETRKHSDGYDHATYVAEAKMSLAGRSNPAVSSSASVRVGSARLSDGYVSTCAVTEVAGTFAQLTRAWSLPLNNGTHLVRTGSFGSNSATGGTMSNTPAIFAYYGGSTMTPLAPTRPLICAIAGRARMPWLSGSDDYIAYTYPFGGPVKPTRTSYYGLRLGDELRPKTYTADGDPIPAGTPVTVGGAWKAMRWCSIPDSASVYFVPGENFSQRLRWYRYDSDGDFTEVGHCGRWVTTGSSHAEGDITIGWDPAEHPREVLWKMYGQIIDVEEASGLVATRIGTVVYFYIDKYLVGQLDTSWPLIQLGANPWSTFQAGIRLSNNSVRHSCHLAMNPQGGVTPWLAGSVRRYGDTAPKAAFVRGEETPEANLGDIGRDVSFKRSWR